MIDINHVISTIAYILPSPHQCTEVATENSETSRAMAFIFSGVRSDPSEKGGKVERESAKNKKIHHSKCRPS